jgi:hypothetical protein
LSCVLWSFQQLQQCPALREHSVKLRQLSEGQVNRVSLCSACSHFPGPQAWPAVSVFPPLRSAVLTAGRCLGSSEDERRPPGWGCISAKVWGLRVKREEERALAERGIGTKFWRQKRV